MHDARRAYEPDAVVVEVEDWADQRPTIATPRARTEDLVMYVYVDGAWHRRLPDLSATSCGLPYNGQFARTNREDLSLPISLECECFTTREHADHAKIVAREGR